MHNNRETVIIPQTIIYCIPRREREEGRERKRRRNRQTERTERGQGCEG